MPLQSPRKYTAVTLLVDGVYTNNKDAFGDMKQNSLIETDVLSMSGFPLVDGRGYINSTRFNQGSPVVEIPLYAVSDSAVKR